jgi:hypothetical protein
MNTGENEQGLRKIIDLTRLISIAILLLHFYYYCYKAFEKWQWTTTITDRLLSNFQSGGLFDDFNFSKLISLILLCISLIGARGKKDEKLNAKSIIAWFIFGITIYFLSALVIHANSKIETIAIAYMLCTSIGFLIVLSSGTTLSRLIKIRTSKDIFKMYVAIKMMKQN